MPIRLTTPWNPGNYDPGKTYPRAILTALTIYPELKRIHLVVDFGDVIDNKWKTGDASLPNETTVKEEAYDTMVAAVPQEGETIYQAVKRVSYAYLLATVPELAGTIE
jgi:hypothetical protein